MLEEGVKIPQHIAIILDGNGRWAKSKGMPRNFGHTQGAINVENICEKAYNMGVKYLTVYAFSTENWSRPSDEVKALMTLLRQYMKKCKKLSSDNNMRVRVIGDRTRLDEDLRTAIDELEEFSKDMDGLNFTVALNYGSQDEMLRAMNKIIGDIGNGELPADTKVDKALFESYLDTADIPDPDLLIRTSGEQRLSNYLLWQLAYAEFYFAEVHWPDFDESELEKAILAYNKRDRRYGGVK